MCSSRSEHKQTAKSSPPSSSHTVARISPRRGNTVIAAVRRRSCGFLGNGRPRDTGRGLPSAFGHADLQRRPLPSREQRRRRARHEHGRSEPAEHGRQTYTSFVVFFGKYKRRLKSNSSRQDQQAARGADALDRHLVGEELARRVRLVVREEDQGHSHRLCQRVGAALRREPRTRRALAELFDRRLGDRCAQRLADLTAFLGICTTCSSPRSTMTSMATLSSASLVRTGSKRGCSRSCRSLRPQARSPAAMRPSAAMATSALPLEAWCGGGGATGGSGGGGGGGGGENGQR